MHLEGGTILSHILRAGGVNISAAIEKSAGFDDHMAMQVALTMPEGVANFLSPGPTIFKDAKASPEWRHRKGAMDVEMARLVNKRGAAS